MKTKLAGTAIVAMLTVTPLVATLTSPTPAAAAPADAYAKGHREALQLAARACSGISDESAQEECDNIMRRASMSSGSAPSIVTDSTDSLAAYVSGRKDGLKLAVRACDGISNEKAHEECDTIMRTLRENER